VAKKELFHSTKKCGGRYDTKYTSECIPYLECESCGNKVEDWIKWQDTYKGFWKIEDKWQSKKDHIVTLLSYFNHLYSEYYKTDFTFSLTEKGLFRGPEAYHTRRLLAMLGSNPIHVRNYMDWVFDTKVGKRKSKITSLGFLSMAGVVAEFKLHQQKAKQIGRDTPLPGKMLSWIKSNIPDLNQYVALSDHGDLHVLLTHYKGGHLNNVEPVDKFIEALKVSEYIDSNYSIRNWSE